MLDPRRRASNNPREERTEVVPHVVVAVNQPIQHFATSFRCAAASLDARVSVLYWTLNPDGMFDPEFDRHVSWDAGLLSGYRWQSAEGATSISRAVSFITSMGRLKPDVVVCFGWASAAARLTILWCLATGLPILFYGDTSWQNTSRGPRQWLRQRTLRTAFGFAAGALSSGAFNREFYIFLGMRPGRIYDSVYPIDVAAYAAVREQRQVRKKRRIIGFAGKLIPARELTSCFARSSSSLTTTSGRHGSSATERSASVSGPCPSRAAWLAE